MKNGEYENVEQMDADLTLMFENAKRYNMPNSSIYKRALRLQQILQVIIYCVFPCAAFHFAQDLNNSVLPFLLLFPGKKEGASEKRR